MPGMRLFGRRCSLATDDFFFIGAFEAVIFLPWLAWIPVVYASYLRERHNCPERRSLALTDAALPCVCALFLANWLIACLFLIFSVKGTITKPEPRRHVVSLVYLKLVVSLMDVACAVLGTVIMVNDSYCNILGMPLLIKMSTLFIWIATVIRAGMAILFYNWNSSKSSTKVRIQKEYFTSAVRTGTMRRWNIRLQALFLWCTTPSEARKEAIKTASELMALLSCDLDLVASDVIAGMLLYRQKCLLKWKDETTTLNASPPITQSDGASLDHFPPEGLPDWMNFHLARRYFDVGLGIFGWPWYMYRNFACGCCHLLRRLTCCFSCFHDSKVVLGDNCCGCNLAGLQATTGLPYEDLVHVSFVDRVFEVPFFVTYDHESQSVVVTARGTMSLDDVLTDVAAGFAVMDDPGCPPGALCHHGMLMAAREIKAKLEEKQILENALREKPGYQLIVTGHSLGASVASILSLLLRQSYPNVRCFAFAPPPTLNKIALPFSYRNVFTVFYGNDSVPYLNYENVKYMVEEMVKCLEECNMPKFKVFLNYKKHPPTSDSNETSEGKANGTCGTENFTSIDAMKHNSADFERGDSAPCVTESLYIAGTIVHIRLAEDGYRLRVSKADDYRPLAFRPNMIFHHFPQNMQECLHRLGKHPVVDAKGLLLDDLK